MKDQHTKIKGYRDLSQTEIDLINEGKELAEQVGAWIEKLEYTEPEYVGDAEDIGKPLLNWDGIPDGEWLADAKITLQKGFMSAIRSIAKPETF